MDFCTDIVRILSEIPGRVRLRLTGWTAGDRGRIEGQLRRVAGVREVEANPLTGNVLIHFDPVVTTGQALLTAANALRATPNSKHRLLAACRPTAKGKKRAPLSRAAIRAGLRGLIGHALVDTVFYAVVFIEPFGLPLAGLGVLHLWFDVAAWSVALAPLAGVIAASRTEDGQHPARPNCDAVRPATIGS